MTMLPLPVARVIVENCSSCRSLSSPRITKIRDMLPVGVALEQLNFMSNPQGHCVNIRSATDPVRFRPLGNCIHDSKRQERVCAGCIEFWETKRNTVLPWQVRGGSARSGDRKAWDRWCTRLHTMKFVLDSVHSSNKERSKPSSRRSNHCVSHAFDAILARIFPFSPHNMPKIFLGKFLNLWQQLAFKPRRLIHRNRPFHLQFSRDHQHQRRNCWMPTEQQLTITS